MEAVEEKRARYEEELDRVNDMLTESESRRLALQKEVDLLVEQVTSNQSSLCVCVTVWVDIPYWPIYWKQKAVNTVSRQQRWRTNCICFSRRLGPWTTNRKKAAVRGLISQTITALSAILVGSWRWLHLRRLVPTLWPRPCYFDCPFFLYIQPLSSIMSTEDN